MKQNRKKGFTMTELIVVIVITVILAAVLIPSVILYMRKAEFRKNNENAKTVYLTAETMLTYYRASGQWEEFCAQIKDVSGDDDHGTPNTSLTGDKAGRIYAITLKRGAYKADDDNYLVNQLLSSLSYDATTMEDGAISIEIDVNTGQVYSAFYATQCDELNYNSDDTETTLTMNKRAYDERKSRLLGYYCVDGVTDVADLNPTRLKVTNLSLVNSETLYLNWSSNSKGNQQDVEFDIAFYKEGETETPLFTTTLDLGANGNGSAVTANGTAMVAFTLKDKDGNEIADKWYFPVSYENGTISLVLDAMMSADVLKEQELYADACVNNSTMASIYKEVLRTKSTSITRLAEQVSGKAVVNEAFAKPIDIYATVKANPGSSNNSREYNASDPVTSNTANTLYADDAETKDGNTTANLSAMRHLSNIRYCTSDKATFTVTAKNMDWEAVGAGLYVDNTNSAAKSAGVDDRLAWADSDGIAFPSIPELKGNYTLTSTSKDSTKIANLILNADSVADDATVDALVADVNDTKINGANAVTTPVSADYAQYIGLFCESNGTIEKLTIENPSVTLIADTTGKAFTTFTTELEAATTNKIIKKATATADKKGFQAAANLQHIRGVGVVAGRAQGSLTDISVTTTKASTRIMTVCLEKNESWGTTSADQADKKNYQSAAVGGIVGVMARQNTDGGYKKVDDNTKMENLTVSGSIWAYLPSVISDNYNQYGDDNVGSFADDYSYGVGGIIGYGNLAKSGVQMTDCTNAAAVTANYFAGGIIGHVEGKFDSNNTDATLNNCTNTGLILSNAKYDATKVEGTSKIYMQGQFFGGIVGFGKNTKVESCTSSAGSSSGYTYDADDVANKNNLLVGRYVGGIVGYGYESLVDSCSTKSGGYVLGSDYVGGIVGAMASKEGNAANNIEANSGSKTTTNASFIIGNNYVGGIVGENKEGQTIQNCVNNGVAVAYGKFAGGIVGYNNRGATISDCASYLSDYSGSIYNKITTEWQATGDYVGGIAGYNDGKVVFTNESKKITVESVSSVIAGRNYVGGVIGFNDTNGTLNMEYDLIAGSIYASGDCAGGLIGLNASVAVLESAETIEVKPQKVVGNNCVGGVIGANVVCLTKDVSMSNLAANNKLCTITANAFAGGIIGWHRAYTLDELEITAQDTTDEEGNTVHPSLYTECLKNDEDGTKQKAILPQLSSEGLITNADHAANAYSLTISDAANNTSSMSHATNSIDITANGYVGGIVGSCDEYSSLTIVNCINTGALSLRTDDETELSVKVSNFLYAECLGDAYNELVKAKEEIGDIETQFAGGIIGLNGYNQVINNCTNKGTMSGFTALGGIAGVNMGYVTNCTQTENFGSAAMDYVGGIVGINVGTTADRTYTSVITTWTTTTTVDETRLEAAAEAAAIADAKEKAKAAAKTYFEASDYYKQCELVYYDYKNNSGNGNNNRPGAPINPEGPDDPGVSRGNYTYRCSAAKPTFEGTPYIQNPFNGTSGMPGTYDDPDNKIASSIYVYSNRSNGKQNPLQPGGDQQGWTLLNDCPFPNPAYADYSDSWDKYREQAYTLWRESKDGTAAYDTAYKNAYTELYEQYYKQLKESYTETTTVADSTTHTGSYTTGTVEDCAVSALHTVSGKSVVGGIAGYNLVNGSLIDNTCPASVSGAGDDVGGIAGRNAGTVAVAADTTSTLTRTIASSNGKYIGGLVGYNEEKGTVKVSDSTDADVVAVSSAAQVSGSKYVGGLIGGNAGAIDTSITTTAEDDTTTTTASTRKLVSAAASVRATDGYAGGALGRTTANVENLGSRCGTVSANTGYAGGVLPEVEEEIIVTNCFAVGTVRSNAGTNGYAGGIAAVNNGTISACTVGDTNNTSTLIESKVQECAGAIAAINYAGATIINCTLANDGVKLSCNGTEYGGLTGENYGTIADSSVSVMPTISSTATGLSVGGAAAVNCAGATVQNVTVSCAFTGDDGNGFTTYRYLGGVVGENQAASDEKKAGLVTDCTYAGTITEKSGSAGNCYGGIVGYNGGALTKCTLGTITMTINGVYSATSTSSTKEKEQLATHAGGIVGKNDEGGTVSVCYITGSKDSSMTATNGMLGGIVGFNKGSIEDCGDQKTVADMVAAITDENKEGSVIDKLSNLGYEIESDFVKWNGNEDLENFTFTNDTSRKVSSNRDMQLYMKSNGNLGGIAAYNAGVLAYCASGNWFLNNKSASIDVGTGGVIGVNDTANDLSFLLNRAFVGRQLQTKSIDRSAGGVIGTQNSTSAEGWTLTNCVNYGTVYCKRTNYAGGIIGQWTGKGGTVEDCRNYGTLQAICNNELSGGCGGIVAQIYHAQRDNGYNIISCENYGSIYGLSENNMRESACYSAGILGVITGYQVTAGGTSASIPYTVRVLDCVNGPGVEIYSRTIASGIVGFATCDNATEDYIKVSTALFCLYVERCRNFASGLNGETSAAGILGDRLGLTSVSNTYMYDNISVSPDSGWGSSDQGKKAFVSDAYSDGIKNNWEKTTKEGKKISSNFARNYFIDTESLNYEDMVLKTGAISEGESVSTSKEIVYKRSSLNANQKYVNGNRAYIVRTTDGKYVLIGVEDNKTVDGNSCINTVSEKIMSSASSTTVVGSVLCDLNDSNDKYKNLSTAMSADEQTNNEALYRLLRDMYCFQEGVTVTETGKKLIEPESVSAELGDSSLSVTITPQTNTYNENYNPFAYEVRIVRTNEDGTVQTDENGNPVVLQGQDNDGNGEQILLYTETGSVAISEDVSGNVAVQVRAVSMYEDDEENPVARSEWVTSGKSTITGVLPEPEIRVELVRDKEVKDYTSGATNTILWQWKFTLVNAEEYGKEDYVYVKFGNLEMELNSDNTNNYSQLIKWSGTRLTMAQARSKTEGVANSSWVLFSTCLPNATPSISLKKGANYGYGVSWSITGKTKEDLSVSVTVDASNSGSVETAPIYEVDLIGTYTDENGEHEETVLATQDLLLSAENTSTVTFEDLPDTVLKAKDLKIRVWYASTGLGPAYTWHEVTESEVEPNNSAYVKILNVDEETNGTSWSYRYSVVLSNLTAKTKEEPYKNSSVGFDDYRYTSTELFTWLDAPKFVYDTEGYLLDPTYDESDNNALHYRFYWDADEDYVAGASYTAELYGVTDDKSEVLIDTYEMSSTEGDGGITTGEVDGKNAYMLEVDADDWSYTRIHLKVSRLGDGETTVGQSSDVYYSVRKRLDSPAQPTVSIVSSDELDYTVTWAAISPEQETDADGNVTDGCVSYTLYLQEYDESESEFGKAEELKTLKIADGEDGVYTTTVSLDAYAGKRIRLYVVANAEDTSKTYVSSAAGISYEMTVLERIKTPEVEFTGLNNWGLTHETKDAFSTTEFLTSGLVVNVTSTGDVVPPGGSTYLLRAFVYDTKEEAKAMIDANKESTLSLDKWLKGTKDAETNLGKGCLAAYEMTQDTNGNITAVTPVSMTATDSTQKNYTHTVTSLSTDYAGKWIVFQTRIASGDGDVSSAWVTVDAPWQLPYVQLDEPDVTTELTGVNVTVKVGSDNIDMPGEETKTWEAQQTAYEWNSVDHADMYALTVQNVTGDAVGTASGKTYRFRFIEHDAVEATDTTEAQEAYVEVQEYDEDTKTWHSLTVQTDENGNVVNDDAGNVVYVETKLVNVEAGSDADKLTGSERADTETLYEHAVKGAYTTEDDTSKSYEATFACTLTVSKNLNEDGTWDGTWHYKLILPDTEKVTYTDDGNTTTMGVTLRLTHTASFTSALLQNQTDQASDQYINSKQNAFSVNE